MRWIAVLLLAACGSGPPASEPELRPSGANLEGHRGHIGARDSSIPTAANPKERIVFLRSGSVWIMKGDGSEATQLSVRSLEAGHESPALSPDGTKVAYIAPDKGAYRLVVMDLTELVPTEVTNGHFGQAGEPSWSPDGKSIALMRGDARDARDLVIIPSSGGEPRVLMQGADDYPELAGSPAWSPDGSTIAVASDRRLGKGTLLWLVDVKSGTPRALTEGREDGTMFHDITPAWTPDGKRIVFASNRHASNPDQKEQDEIYIIDASGKNMMRLTDAKGSSFDPSVSPGGKRLYFTSTRDAVNPYEKDIYVMSSSGGAAARLSDGVRPQNSAPHAGVVR